MFLLFPQLPGGMGIMAAIKELNKIVCKILRLSATSAAVERSFSCYSNVHKAKRNRLSNERAGKVVLVSQNINLDT